MTIDFVVRRDHASHHVRFADSVLLPKIPVFKRRPVNPKQRQTETKFFLPAINSNDKHPSDWTTDELYPEEHTEFDSRTSLVREGTFVRGNGALWMSKEMNKVWLPAERRQLDLSTERRIVHHLRRKLNRRLERRANLLAKADRDTARKQASRRSTPRIGTPVDPFSSYTEFGDKIKKKHPKDKQQPAALPSSSGSAETQPSKDTAGDLNPKPPLPGIKVNEAVEEEENGLPEGQANGDEGSGSSDSEGPDDIIEPFEEEEVVPEEKDIVVSPVATPLLCRPESRYGGGQLTLYETRVRLLEGDLAVPLNPTSKLIRVYIQSSTTDSEVERTRLIETVFPKLRSLSQEHGYDLHFIDLHWGSWNLMSDDHSQVALVNNVIDQCYSKEYGINFMIFLGQKLGELIVPTSIPVNEFEILLSAAEEEQERQLEETKLQAAAEIARKQAALDKQKERAEMAERAGNTSEASQNGRKLSTFGRRESQTNSLSSRETTRVDARRESLQGRDQNGTAKLQKESSLIRNSRVQANTIDPTLLPIWYKLDSNAEPPVYRLQKISSVYKDILSADVKRRTEAKKQWLNIQKKLIHLFSTVSKQIFDDPAVIKKYNISLTEIELGRCLSYISDVTTSNSYWFQREIEDIHLGVHDDKLEDYQDLLPFTSTVDVAKQTILDDWKTCILPDVIPAKNRRRYKIPWHRNGVTFTFRDHVNYVDRLCKDFGNVISEIIRRVGENEAEVSHIRDELFIEVEQHVMYCQEKAKMFQGRKNMLVVMKRYIRATTRYPLVIYGKSGCGKTQLMAKAAKECHKWIKESDSMSIVRFIGVTSSSRNIRTLLRFLCLQISEIYKESTANIPDDYKGLFNSFSLLLSKATPQKKLVIFIDSLHLLTDDYDGRNLAWLPNELPPNVRLILSTLPDDSLLCLRALKRLIPNARPECFVVVPDMNASEAMAIMEQWLQSAGRLITKDQRDVLLRNFRACPVPLYLRVLYREALTWPSTMSAADVRLGGAVKNVITVFIGRLERDHGEALVRRALGYVTAARSGVSEAELEDLLSLDDVVMTDVMAHYKPAVRRLPSLLWVRLRNDVGEYLAETLADNCVTLTWAHLAFREAAADRYLKSKDKAPSYHKAMAEYFADAWSGKPKPYQGNDAGSPRYALGQPLYRVADDGRTARAYNLRRLNELPYHLIHSQQMSLLKRECLCSFEFLLAKISGVGLRAAFEDFRMALTAEPADLDLKLLSDTLYLSTCALIKDPRQLASQLIGRLHDIVTKDVPAAPADPVKYPALKLLFEQAKSGSIPALIPSITCLTPPGGVLFDQLSGHTEPITAVCLSLDGQRCLTSSKDDTLKMWELRSGRVTKTIRGVGADVHQIAIGGNYAIAITSETARMRLWSLRSGECLKAIDDYEDPARIVTAAEGALLVAFYQGVDVMRVWALGGKFALVHEVQLDADRPKDAGVHQENSIVVGTNAHGPLVLHAHRNTSEASVMNAKKGRVILTLTARKSGCITAMACTPEYFILALKSQYMETHELYSLALFDNRSGKFIREVRGCVEDEVTQLLVNHIGSHAVAVCASEANDATDIAVWNIETEEHKHVGKHARVSHLGACVDLRYCLTAGSGDSTLKIWNLSSMVNQPGTKGRIKDGLEDIIPMTGNSRYVIAKSMNNGPVAVWNIAKGRCAGKAVHIERGLVNSSDVMLVRNTTILVLTDKGFSSVSENSPAVYQTLLVYDLLKKKYIQKLNNCYITPASPHEYVFLSDEQLLGLSDKHSHLVVWSTSTGRVVHRMKANFRDAERRARDVDTSEADDRRRRRATTAKMTPWDRRVESESARGRRHHEEIAVEKKRMEDLHHEKDNIIEQFKISADLSTVVTSHYAHHLCVFDVESRAHVQTLENNSSMLFLYTSAMTENGSHLVHTNYDEEAKLSYLTLWDVREGYVRKRLRNEKDVTCVDVSKDARRVVFGKSTKELRIWEPLSHGTSVRRVKGYPTLNFGERSQIHITDGGRKAVVYAGDISLWDLERAAVLGVFSPDTRIQCFTPAMGGRLVVFGLQDTSDIVTLRLMSSEHRSIERTGRDLFGEAVSSDEDDEEMEAQLEQE